jgi:hypothetical protein
LHPAREAADQLVGTVCQPQPLQQFARSPPCLRGWDARNPREKEQVLPRAELPVDVATAFQHRADVGQREARLADGVVAAHGDLPAVRQHQPQNAFHAGSLARAVCAQQRDNLTCAYLKRDTLQRRRTRLADAVGLVQPLHMQQRGMHLRRPPAAFSPNAAPFLPFLCANARPDDCTLGSLQEAGFYFSVQDF